MKIWRLVFLILFIFGCVEPLHYRYVGNVMALPLRDVVVVYVDIRFDKLDRLEIERGIREWEYALNGLLEFRVEDFDMGDKLRNSGYFIMKIDGNYPDLVELDGLGGKTLAFCDRVGGRYMWVVRDRVVDLRGVVMHEMGHLLGSDHVGEGLMHPNYSLVKYMCIDRESMESVGNVLGVDIGRLNYCII